MTRTLLEIPILHEPREIGIREVEQFWERIKELCPHKSRKYQKAFHKYWDNVDEFLSKRRVQKIYQDGIWADPDLDYQAVVETEMPKTRNQKTLCQLLAQRGKIVPVEDKDLLIGTYLAVKKQDEERMYYLLGLRDEAVARNVDSDLKDGETGVILFGCEHNIGTIIRETYPSIQVQNFEGRTAALYARWKELVRIAKINSEKQYGS